MNFKNFLILSLVILASCSKNPYDTSTPESYVLSMGLVGQQDKNDDPLPYFYDPESAAAIAEFDALAEESKEEFDKFRKAIAERFPNHIEENEEGSLKLALDGNLDENLRTFSLQVSMVGAQMKERSPSDYEFISATEPDSNNISQLSLIITGNEITLPLTKTENGYRMFLTEKVLETIASRIEQLKNLKQVFADANEMIEQEQISDANFDERIEEIFSKYKQAFK